MLLLKWSSMEVKHRLLNFSNKVIYQNDDWFLFSLDSLLLANFVTLRKSDKKILDLCTGNAPVAMFLAMKSKASIVGIELQKEIYDLGEKSVIENAMDKQITLINDDIRNISKYYETDSFDVITCNPPYFKVNDTKMINDNKIKSIARHEIMCNLDSILEISKKMLRTGGVIALVYPVSRLIEIIYKMKENNIEPKKMQIIYPKQGKSANLLLIEGVKNGKSSLKIMPPLYIHNEDGSYKENIRKMFQE